MFLLGSSLNYDVHGDGRMVGEEEAKEIVKGLRKVVLKKACDILSQHCPEHHCKNNINTNDMIDWLQCANAKRKYMLYNSNGLKQLMNERGIQLRGRSNLNKMRDALAGTLSEETEAQEKETNGELDPKLAATKAILEKSFLPHRKGVHWEYASLGHRLEKHILKGWIELTKDRFYRSLAGIEVEGAYTAGLAGKKGANHAKDSIDFVLVVKDPLSTDRQELKAWGFEAKGRVTSKTAADEEHDLPYLLDPHACISCNNVHEEVRDLGERFQVLQHAFVMTLIMLYLQLGIIKDL